MQQLKVGSSLQGGKYKIEKVLGQGGFGITYLAIQELLNRKVAIKEFFYKDYCERDEATSHVTLGTNSNRELVERFMEKFIKEARTISTLNHPHIIRIYDIFKENNTAYYVMEYIEGESLNDMVNRRGALPEDMAVSYIKQVASALEFVHQHSINHLDVKPANIMVRKEDCQAVLIDFGLSKQYDASGEQTSTTPVGISHGYAPMEQYNVGGVGTFSPQTDIYSLGATLYKLVTGNTPPQAIEIFNDSLPELSANISSFVVEAIKKAMQPRKIERPRNIAAFLYLLNLSLVKNNNDETKVLVQQNEKKEAFSSLRSVFSTIYNWRNINKWLVASFIFLTIITLFLGLRLRWNTIDEEQLTTTGIINGHDYVDLGVSVKWATMNVGASGIGDYGDYFAWGEIAPKSEYVEENSVTWKKNLIDISKDIRYDAANANWRGSWRLPTEKEFEELKDSCVWQWGTLMGHCGYKVTGPNGNSMFLPASGWYGTSKPSTDVYGYYWSSSSSVDYTSHAYGLNFYNGFQYGAWSFRSDGRSVRPVSD